ncbi:NUDIX hydrolase [Aliiglaciecola litoralis]|uniref:NUDIX hydrolase n=1 Tax=Aliiglaciecola litoralis TaxID=582857 RepID=A0ABP3WL06_9ALTE
MQNSWLSQLKRLHALAGSGLAFSPEAFDKERYEEIAAISRQMLADLAKVPINQIDQLIIPEQQHYVTPQIAVRGAVFQNDQILLVQEKSDNKWALPGGYADVGYSAVENVKKEIQEEAHVEVTNCQLIALRYKAAGDYDPDVREFYHAIFLCQAPDNCVPKGGLETCDAAFFERNALPPLSTSKTIERDIEDAFRFHQGLETHVLID